MSGSASSSASEALIGRVLLGRYRVVRQLAEGGMGIVYLARVEGAAGFRKPVVIKRILGKLATRPYFVGMFVREAQILAQLRHPSIVDVIELGEEDGDYVMVLEYVAGFHLGQWCAYLKRKERMVPTEICIEIAICVLDALHHVHTQTLPDGTALHITHRDVSPSNILLSTDGYPKLVDFGVARMEADTLFKTEGSGFRGKLAYSAPEMFEGIEAAPQSDVFSCAVVLHELLTGKNEFAGQTQAETLQRVLHHAPQSVHGVRDDAPDDIDVILARALSKTPAERYGSAAEFAQALRRTQRTPEQELRARLAAQLRNDFGELASVLGIESIESRDRAWRRFSLLPPAPADSDAFAIHDQPTRVLDLPTAERQREASEEALLAQTQAIDEPLVSSAPESLPSHEQRAASAHAEATRVRAAVWIALGVVALVAALALWLSLHAASPSPRVVVLQAEQPDRPVASAARASGKNAPQPPAAEPGQPAEATAAVPVATSERATSTKPSAQAPRAASTPDPAALTRAFRRKQAQIEACFAAGNTSAEGAPAIEVHFEVEASGRTLQAQVLPAAIAATPLGACLARAALATRFPPQSAAVAFRIPVTAKRVAVP